ncbi:MAG: DNA replication and repair protein RecF [Ginsengibacter sp.]
MLHLNKVVLTQFKNYNAAAFDFKERIIGICGLNGLGKTNLLDAINYLCFSKSYFSKTDSLNVQMGADGFRLSGEFTSHTSGAIQKVVCIYRNTAKKELYLNDVEYEKFSLHIGKFPCVVIAPDDVEMITGSSEERRKFIDTVLSQMNLQYLQQLISYNKVLLQRNSLLKNFADQQKFDSSLLDVLDEQLVKPGMEIYAMRKDFCEQVIPVVKKFYTEIADNSELIELSYESQLSENDFDNMLKKSRDKDLMLQRTNTGLHKDDITIRLTGRTFKNIASQGQKKSLLFALKLAEFEMLKISKGFAPLLLLDDVFEKLDEKRMQNLLKWVCLNNNGQVFITDTHIDRLSTSLSNFSEKVQIIELN